MKNILKAYFSFNKTERAGIIAFISILLVLLMVRISLRYFVHPAANPQQEQQLVKAWEQFKKSNTPVATKTAEAKPPKEKQIIRTAAKNKLFPFDPNTIDSAGLRRLGLREKTTSIFLHWRAKGKVFRRKEELRKVYTLSEEEYLRLEPYIMIDSNSAR